MSDLTAAQKDKLVNDVQAVINDAEALLKSTANQAGSEAAALRERMSVQLSRAKNSLLDLQHAATEKARAAGHKADDYVHDHPWQAIGMAAGVGMVIGLLIGRR